MGGNDINCSWCNCSYQAGTGYSMFICSRACHEASQAREEEKIEAMQRRIKERTLDAEAEREKYRRASEAGGTSPRRPLYDDKLKELWGIERYNKVDDRDDLFLQEVGLGHEQSGAHECPWCKSETDSELLSKARSLAEVIHFDGPPIEHFLEVNERNPNAFQEGLNELAKYPSLYQAYEVSDLTMLVDSILIVDRLTLKHANRATECLDRYCEPDQTALETETIRVNLTNSDLPYCSPRCRTEATAAAQQLSDSNVRDDVGELIGSIERIDWDDRKAELQRCRERIVAAREKSRPAIEGVWKRYAARIGELLHEQIELYDNSAKKIPAVFIVYGLFVFANLILWPSFLNEDDLPGWVMLLIALFISSIPLAAGLPQIFYGNYRRQMNQAKTQLASVLAKAGVVSSPIEDPSSGFGGSMSPHRWHCKYQDVDLHFEGEVFQRAARILELDLSEVTAPEQTPTDVEQSSQADADRMDDRRWYWNARCYACGQGALRIPNSNSRCTRCHEPEVRVSIQRTIGYLVLIIVGINSLSYIYESVACKYSETCAIFGLCDWDGERCAVSEESCRDSSHCSVKGRCTADLNDWSNRCESTSQRDCQQSEECKILGKCTLDVRVQKCVAETGATPN